VAVTGTTPTRVLVLIDPVAAYGIVQEVRVQRAAARLATISGTRKYRKIPPNESANGAPPTRCQREDGFPRRAIIRVRVHAWAIVFRTTQI
jgi:hypothetical protein